MRSATDQRSLVKRVPSMLTALRRLAPGLLLITAVSALLLWSDWQSRQARGAGAALRVALVQQASQPVLDQTVAGTLEALEARGFRDGGRISLRRYNAEADLPTANAIAREVTSGGNDLVVTITTISMQTVANANRDGARVKHVFGCVSDPFSAGVGLNRDKPLEHPPWMAGFGSLQPVERCFSIARRMNPGLKRVGLVWNPAESNSEAQTRLARTTCAKLGIELMEANAGHSNEVMEALGSLLSRGIEALFVSGDVCVLGAVDVVMGTAARAGVPVFSVIPPTSAKGGLFDLGADYTAIGRMLGDLAADVLEGTDPATVPVENRVPEMLVLNRKTLAALGGSWQFPAELLEEAATVVEADGRVVDRRPKEPVQSRNRATGKLRVDLIEYVETLNVELAREGLLAGLGESGLVDGVDVEVRRRSAQGDIATLSAIVDAAVSDGTDLLLASTTPGLQAALRRGRNTPTVFTLVASPVLAGAGTSDTEHLPHVTGSYVAAPHAQLLAHLKVLLPRAKRVGTLFVPSEVNSVYFKEDLERAAIAAGLELVTVGVSTSGEVPDAAMALCQKGIDAVCQISDNLSGASFASISMAAQRSRVPLFSFAIGNADSGVVMSLSTDFRENGMESGRIAARVLRGESPARIPFVPVTRVQMAVNVRVASEYGITFPQEILAKADQVVR